MVNAFPKPSTGDRAAACERGAASCAKSKLAVIAGVIYLAPVFLIAYSGLMNLIMLILAITVLLLMVALHNRSEG